MSIPAHTLRACRDDAMDLLVLTDDRAKQLVAPILREILELRVHGVPEEKVNALLDALRLCCQFNDSMRAQAQLITGRLDDLARAAHRAERDSLMTAPTVKALAAKLRPHLAIVAHPPVQDGGVYVAAVCALRYLIDSTPFDRLAGGGMRRALGPGRHALLMSFVEGHAEPLLTQHIARQADPTTGRAGGGVRASTVPLEGARLADSSMQAAA